MAQPKPHKNFGPEGPRVGQGFAKFVVSLVNVQKDIKKLQAQGVDHDESLKTLRQDHDRDVKALKADNAELKNANGMLTSRLAALERRVSEVESSIIGLRNSLEEKLGTRIESCEDEIRKLLDHNVNPIDKRLRELSRDVASIGDGNQASLARLKEQSAEWRDAAEKCLERMEWTFKEELGKYKEQIRRELLNDIQQAQFNNKQFNDNARAGLTRAPQAIEDERPDIVGKRSRQVPLRETSPEMHPSKIADKGKRPRMPGSRGSIGELQRERSVANDQPSRPASYGEKLSRGCSINSYMSEDPLSGDSCFASAAPSQPTGVPKYPSWLQRRNQTAASDASSRAASYTSNNVAGKMGPPPNPRAPFAVSSNKYNKHHEAGKEATPTLQALGKDGGTRTSTARNPDRYARRSLSSGIQNEPSAADAIESTMVPDHAGTRSGSSTPTPELPSQADIESESDGVGNPFGSGSSRDVDGIADEERLSFDRRTKPTNTFRLSGVARNLDLRAELGVAQRQDRDESRVPKKGIAVTQAKQRRAKGSTSGVMSHDVVPSMRSTRNSGPPRLPTNHTNIYDLTKRQPRARSQATTQSSRTHTMDSQASTTNDGSTTNVQGAHPVGNATNKRKPGRPLFRHQENSDGEYRPSKSAKRK